MKKLFDQTLKDHSKYITQTFKKVLGFVLFAAVVSSCIPNEKVIYMQNQEDDPSLALDSLIPLIRQDYLLQPNDEVLISFYSEVSESVSEFNLTSDIGGNGQNGNGQNGNNNNNRRGGGSIFNVDKDGFIEINLLGKIQASGLSIYELKENLENLIRDQEGVNDILVRVSLGFVNFYMFGEVGGGGLRSIQGNEATILQALAEGDLSINANRERVQIFRQYPEGVRIHEINVLDRNLIRSKYYFIQPNDVIYVMPLKIREIGYGTSALANLSVIVSTLSSAFIIIALFQNN
jgi:polysaccharide biosynthesis/export protein